MKKLCSILLVIVMGLLPVGVFAADDNEEMLSYDATIAYKSVIDNAIAKYGVYKNKERATGVGLAMLIDFDGNGTLELLIGCENCKNADSGNDIYGEDFFEVYGYNDGIYKLTHTWAMFSMRGGFRMELKKWETMYML